ncbi:MAG: hypothetical protein IID34_01930 [Planctomycetes bacterium]|nr:hypothetical protein [Planctomycetota bacterium]
MNIASINTRAARPSARRHTLGVLVIIGVTMAAHAWSLGDGLVLDDHLHQYALREAQWSFTSLIDSATIEPARFIHAWWQDKTVRWDYTRPVTMAWTKALRSLTGSSITAQHVSVLAWHACCCVLVYGLGYQITRRRSWSLFAAVVFVIYPHNAYAVSWLASQNAVMQTTLTLAALLCYVRASKLSLHQGAAGFSLRESATASSASDRRTIAQAEACGSLGMGAFGVALVLFACGLFCRENAVVFPFLAMAFDFGFGGREHLKRRWKAHALMLALAGAFALWRINLFESHVPTAYLRQPDDWSYVPWYLAKLLHYLACVVWQAPLFVGPTRYRNPFIESTADCMLMVTIVLVFGCGYALACRRIRGWWIWPAWILLSVLPVVPFLATPHMAYMAGVGFVIALILKPATAPPSQSRVSRGVAIGMLLLSIGSFSVYRLCWRGVVAAEHYTIAQMTANPPPPPDSDIFIINLPLANVYLPLNLEKAWNIPADALRTHVLTYAPHPLIAPKLAQQVGPDPPYRQGAAGFSLREPSSRDFGITSIEQIDAHSFTIAIENQSYFSGLLGRLLTDDMREAGRFRHGEIVRGELFDVEILESGSNGVQKLKFTFQRPLADDRHRFYVITEDCPGAEVKFHADPRQGDRSPETVGGAHPTIECRDLPRAPEFRRKRDLLFTILDVTGKIIQTDLYLTRSEAGN